MMSVLALLAGGRIFPLLLGSLVALPKVLFWRFEEHGIENSRPCPGNFWQRAKYQAGCFPNFCGTVNLKCRYLFNTTWKKVLFGPRRFLPRSGPCDHCQCGGLLGVICGGVAGKKLSENTLRQGVRPPLPSFGQAWYRLAMGCSNKAKGGINLRVSVRERLIKHIVSRCYCLAPLPANAQILRRGQL